MSNAIEKSQQQQQVVRLAAQEGPTWTPERIALVKRQVCPAGISNDEFAVFLDRCQRSGLDPLNGEAYCVPRRVKVKRPNGSEEWVEVPTFQPAEAGLASRAQRSPLFAGMRAAVVYERDVCEIDAAASLVRHSFDAAKPRGKLVGAWAHAQRKDVATPVVFVLFDEYRQNNQMWQSKPATMIVKVARAQAWRAAFPIEFSGLYVPEELDSGGDLVRAETAATAETVGEAPAAAAPRSKTAALLAHAERTRAQLATPAPRTETVDAPPAVAEAVEPAPAPAPSPPAEKAAAPAPTTLADLPLTVIEERLAVREAWLERAKASDPSRERVVGERDRLRAERERRLDAAAEDGPPQEPESAGRWIADPQAPF